MNLSVFIKDKFKGITSLGLEQNLQKLCTILSVFDVDKGYD